MNKQSLYPFARKVPGQSFVGVKRQTVPNQSMSLREIIKRFVRKESLPISQQGVYNENHGDLEKMSKEDIFDQMEHVDHFKQVQKKFKKQEQEKFDAQEKARKEKDLTDKQKSDAALLKPPHTPPT